MNHNFKDIKGQRFSRLLVDKYIGTENGKATWRCLCDCGTSHVTSGDSLRQGKVKSCGCFYIEKRTKGMNLKHGMDGTRFNGIYWGMLARVNDKTDSRYGGRGIKCLWATFVEFRNDMYESYLKHVQEFGEKNTQIDRKNNDGNYSKENCRWATIIEQANNRRPRRSKAREALKL